MRVGRRSSGGRRQGSKGGVEGDYARKVMKREGALSKSDHLEIREAMK